jgi:hypothetical protein
LLAQLLKEAILEQQRVASSRTDWGNGRAAFRANRPAIQKLLDEDWPLTTIYQRVQDSLAGISYRQFINLVRKNFPSTSQLRRTKNNALTQSISSAQSTPVVESPVQTPKLAAKETTKDETLDTTPPPKPAPFEFIKSYKPGPKVPNLKDLF